MGREEGEYVPEEKWERVNRDDLLLYAWGVCSDRDLARKYSFLTPREVEAEGPPVIGRGQSVDAIIDRELQGENDESDR
ncbi:MULTISPECIES: hypothetical protein [Halorussus]|uniref:hypothetical protein n=1 Tax=Halorussus TaxID=1070314 RepID=UPI00209C8948|nr:hypothetical protein [Halorussus vallis]USZ78652.1 hypothetical protein NGM07_25215 [Halorussus vallis]USZ78683.1 hypothetical protein NGM07_24545 [Halorussus vallis]